MGLKSFYHKLEDKYFNFLDKLESKGINLYKIIDPLEKKGVPTFAIFSLIFIAAIVLILFAIFGNSAVVMSDGVTFTFMDSTQNIISNQNIKLKFDDDTKLLETDDYGVANVTGLEKRKYTIDVVGDTYSLESPIEIDLLEKENWNIYLKSNLKEFSKTLIFKKNNESYSIPFTIDEIKCSENTNYIKEEVYVTNGSLTLDDVPSNCGLIDVSFSNYVYTSMDLEVTEDQKTGVIYLSSSSSQEYGGLVISVKDIDSGLPLSNISIDLYDLSNIKINSTITSENGLAQFSSVPIGKYSITSYDNNQVYGETTIYDGIYIDVYEGSTLTKELKLKKEIVGNIKFKVIDNDTLEVIPNVKVTLFKGEETVIELITDAQGLVSFGLKENVSYNASFDHSNYTVKYENNILTNDAIKTIKLNMINQETVSGLLVNVVDEFSNPIEYANIKIYDLKTNTILKTVVADVYGQAIISNLDSTKTYQLEAVKGKFVSEKSNPFMIIEREINQQTIIMKNG